MEPCSSDEFFQALNHAEQTFKKMENYLRHKQLCDVILVAGDPPEFQLTGNCFSKFLCVKYFLDHLVMYVEVTCSN